MRYLIWASFHFIRRLEGALLGYIGPSRKFTFYSISEIDVGPVRGSPETGLASLALTPAS